MKCSSGLGRLSPIFVLLLTICAHAAPLSPPKPVESQAPVVRQEKSAAASKLLPVDQPGFGQTAEAAKFEEVCPGVRIQETDDFKWKDMERRLICGDAKSDSVGEPWADIPPNQAAYFLRGFLQARGFHQPVFIQDGEQLYVRPGAISKLKEFKIFGGPSTWDPPKRRLVQGLPLTPPLLNDLQAWALSQIKDEGYACATDSSRADPATGEAVVDMVAGDPKIITALETSGDTGLAQGALDRYNAFHVGDLYRERLIALTRRRTTDDGFLQTLVLNTKCEPNGVRIVRDVVLGPSRTVSIGAGGNTDEGPLVRAIVRQNRIGDYASSASGQINLSYLRSTVNHQVAQAKYHWFYAPGEERSYVEPLIQFEHLAEEAKDTSSANAKIMHGWNQERQDGQFEVRVGPNLLYAKQARGEGAQNSSVAYMETSASWKSHDWEYFNTSPRSGGTVEASALIAQKQFGSQFTAQRFRINGQKLWEIFRFDPPLLILATRFDLNALFSPDGNITSDVPRPFLTFMGGERDVRGFDLASLPRNQLGSLSGASVSGEARLHKVIFRRADVFSFLDAGVLGDEGFALKKPIFLSPGLGLRWESPVGVLRTYLAKRFVAQQPEGEVPYDDTFRLGFTFGEEF